MQTVNLNRTFRLTNATIRQRQVKRTLAQGDLHRCTVVSAGQLIALHWRMQHVCFKLRIALPEGTFSAPSRPYAMQMFAEHAIQLVSFEWFCKKAIHADRQTGLSIRQQRIGRHGNNGHA